MLPKRWVFPDVDPRQSIALAHLLSVSRITAALLLARGVVTKEQADRWLSPHESIRHDPFLIPDLPSAVDRFHHAVARREPICFYGDYDVDGMSATSIYTEFFRACGGDVRWYIPHRLREGYGLNETAVRRLAAEGVRLLVTSDCGTTSHREIEVARRLGVDVIVTDHHQSDGGLPAALAVMNPHRPDSAYPFTQLCSAGLAYKVVHGYQSKYGAPSALRADAFLDLAALATVADVVPLQDENRSIVRAGLELITAGVRPGLRALKQVAGIDRACSAGTIAFRLAPRINAAGRLAHADLGVQLLTTQSESEAWGLANQLEQLNTERQHIEERMTAEAIAAVGEGDRPPAIVVASKNWHLGVVGIVAARLVERYHRPAIVLAIDEHGIAKGSARSISGFDLYQALSQCRELLLGFGGHPSAAGLTLEERCLADFTSMFQRMAGMWVGEEHRNPLLRLDAEVKLMDIDPRIIRELDLLHPFGAGNPEPVLAVRDVTIMNARTVGDGHLKLVVRQGRSMPVESIGFRMGSLAARGLSSDRPVDLAFMPELNHWNGFDRIQLRIRDIRMAAPN